MSNIPRTGLNKPKTKKEIQNKKCYPLQFWSLRADLYILKRCGKRFRHYQPKMRSNEQKTIKKKKLSKQKRLFGQKQSAGTSVNYANKHFRLHLYNSVGELKTKNLSKSREVIKNEKR